MAAALTPRAGSLLPVQTTSAVSRTRGPGQPFLSSNPCGTPRYPHQDGPGPRPRCWTPRADPTPCSALRPPGAVALPSVLMTSGPAALSPAPLQPGKAPPWPAPACWSHSRVVRAADGPRRAHGSPSASRLPHGSHCGQRFASQVLWVLSCTGDAAGNPKSCSETQPCSASALPGWMVGEGPCRAGRGEPPWPAGLTRTWTQSHAEFCPLSPHQGWRPALGLRGPLWAFPSPSPLPVVSKTQGGACRGGFSREADAGSNLSQSDPLTSKHGSRGARVLTHEQARDRLEPGAGVSLKVPPESTHAHLCPCCAPRDKASLDSLREPTPRFLHQLDW